MGRNWLAQQCTGGGAGAAHHGLRPGGGAGQAGCWAGSAAELGATHALELVNARGEQGRASCFLSEEQKNRSRRCRRRRQGSWRRGRREPARTGGTERGEAELGASMATRRGTAGTGEARGWADKSSEGGHVQWREEEEGRVCTANFGVEG